MLPALAGTKGSTARARGQSGRDLAKIEAEIGEDAAHPARLGVIALFQGIERLDLVRLVAIERDLQSGERTFDAALRLRRRKLHTGIERRARLQVRLALWRRNENDG